jgi:pyruvate,water dikinase
MTPYTLPLDSSAASDRAKVGSKAARLAELTSAGFPVPAGFVVSVDAARAFARAHQVTAASPAAAVNRLPIPDEVADAVRHALRDLGEGPVAVRSSATAEDLAGASFAGLYESVLDVCGEKAVLDAVARVWASAHAGRVRLYDGEAAGCETMAVLIQRMVRADAAGVAFTADPVSGARDVTMVSAVSGVGERLVSGTASAEEWRIERGVATCIRNDRVVGAETVGAVADLARRIESREGLPQDIEWASHDGAIYLLQARPMTALPPAVSWEVPAGGWVRNFRLGEWIGDPVTPSFDSWLLSGIEDGMHGHFAAVMGWQPPRPYHVVVNGWYYYGLNFTLPGGPSRFATLVRVPWMIATSLLNLRAVLGLTPPTAHLGFNWCLREWRERLWPAYRALVASAESAIETVPINDVPGWIDRLAATVGRNFGSVLAVGGYAAKTELPLAQFISKQLPDLEGSWLELVRAGDTADPAPHDVQGLDWVHPTLGELALDARKPDPEVRSRIVEERDALTVRIRQALADRPRLARRFDRLLAEAQRSHAVREEQARVMTLAWPVLRRAIRRIGQTLVDRGVIDREERVFFLTRDEIVGGLTNPSTPALASVAVDRRRTWDRQRRLAAPLVVGTLPKFFQTVFDQVDRMIHGDEPQRPDEIRGMPGSPGRVTGPVKVIRSVDECHRLQPGDVLVARVTTPAWTPAFARAAAVVTDTGSIASHASIVAREYGLPAVVATGNATSRLRDGQIVTVDGGRATVRIAPG